MPLIVEHDPAFVDRWKAHEAKWAGEPHGLCLDVSAYSAYIMDRMNRDQQASPQQAFALVERLLVEGDEEVKDAIKTCFLENIANAASHSTFDVRRVARLLGPRSRAYWRAWDEFTGVHTPGL